MEFISFLERSPAPALQCDTIIDLIFPVALTAGVLEKCSEREEGGPDAAVEASQASQIDLVCLIGYQQQRLRSRINAKYEVN